MSGRRTNIPEGETLWREHLANERTMLSWIRTGVNLIGVGVLACTLSGVISGGYSPRWLADLEPDELLLLGLGLLLGGAVIEVSAFVRFALYRRDIVRGKLTSSAPLYLLIALSFVIFGAAFTGFAILS